MNGFVAFAALFALATAIPIDQNELRSGFGGLGGAGGLGGGAGGLGGGAGGLGGGLGGLGGGAGGLSGGLGGLGGGAGGSGGAGGGIQNTLNQLNQVGADLGGGLNLGTVGQLSASDKTSLTGFQKGLDASLLNGLIQQDGGLGLNAADGGVNAHEQLTIGGQKVGLGVDTSVQDIVNGKEPDVSVSGLQMLSPIMGPLQSLFSPLNQMLGGQGALTSGLFQIPAQLIARLRTAFGNVLGGLGGLGGGLGGLGGAGGAGGAGADGLGGLGAGLGGGNGGGMAFGFGR